MWTAKSSNSGFSVSLFWPSSKVNSLKSQRKRRRNRKGVKASVTSKLVDVATTTSSPVHLASTSANYESHPTMTPNKAQSVNDTNSGGNSSLCSRAVASPPAPNESTPSASELSNSSDLDVDLLSCADVCQYTVFMEFPILILPASLGRHQLLAGGKRRPHYLNTYYDGSLLTAVQSYQPSALILIPLVLISLLLSLRSHK